MSEMCIEDFGSGGGGICETRSTAMRGRCGFWRNEFMVVAVVYCIVL